jgi:hypothetical protein
MKIVPSKILIIIVLLSVQAFAAPGPPPPEVPPPGLPIDGGILFLVVAALGYGLFKINQRKLNKKTPV